MTTRRSPGTPLPAESDAFVGRDRDVTDVVGLLREMRVVTLCGPGGIGKTRLAVRVVGTVLEAAPRDVWFVDLADAPPGGPPEAVGRRVAAAMEIVEEDGRFVAGVIADALGSRDALLVLDNCEHLVEDSATLAGLLLTRCPGLRILATSREPLRMSAETVYRVPPLEPAEAERLFTERAVAVRPDFAATAAVAEVCRALDGVPLALELAAARVRVLSAEQIAARLTDRFNLLSAGDRTAPPRQRTLRAAIDWSHDLLGPRERVLLRRLAVFAGWTLAQAERVCADDPPALSGLGGDDLLDLLTALSDRSLAAVAGEVAGETRFRLLDSIRQYAAEHLAAAGEDAEVRRRHRDAVLETAERDAELALGEIPATWADRVALFRRYDAELGNVRAALQWSLERREFEEGLRLCTALRTYWIVRGRVGEWVEWTDRFLVAGTGLPAYVHGPGLAGRAQLAAGGRDFTQAGQFAARALEPCRKSGDDFMAAVALTTRAESEIVAGRFDEATVHLDEAAAIARAPGQEWNRGYVLLVRARMRMRENRLRDARELFEQGLAVMREIDQQWGAASALIGLGQVAVLRGDLAAGRSCFTAALPALEEIGARPERARALLGIGRVALAQGDPADARESLREALRLCRSAGIRADLARALTACAELLAAEGDERGAVVLAGAAAGLDDAAATSGHVRRPGAGARLESVLEPLRRSLGDAAVARLWAEGRVVTPDEAVTLALRGPGDPADAADAADAADRPSVPRPRAAAPASPPSTLTAREREIALLVARGLSNRGIAEELFISPATVARHVTNILTKLGFTSRAQVAAWAVDAIPDDAGA